MSPDVGGIKVADSYAKELHVQVATVAKKRKSDTEVDSSYLIGEVKNRNVLLVDDLTTTAGTLTSAARVCKEHGALSVKAAVTHAVLTDMAVERLRDSEIEELITTNSIPTRKAQLDDCRMTVLCIAALLGEGIKRIHGTSPSAGFSTWTRSSEARFASFEIVWLHLAISPPSSVPSFFLWLSN